MMIDKWHLRFLRLAREVSSWSGIPILAINSDLLEI